MSSLSTLLRGAVGSSGNLRLLGLLTNRALLSTAAASGPASAAGLAKLVDVLIAASKNPASAAAALALLSRLSVVAVALGPSAGAAATAIQLLVGRHLSSLAGTGGPQSKTESRPEATTRQPDNKSVKSGQEPAAAQIPKSFPRPQGAAPANKSGPQHDLAHRATAKRSRLFWRSSARPRLASNRNAASRSLHSLSKVKARDLERSLTDAKQNEDLLLPSPDAFLQLINRALKTSKRQFAHARQRLQQASEARRRRVNALRPQPRLTSSRKGRAHRQSRHSRASSRAWRKLCALYGYFLARVKLMRALLQSVTARPAAAAAGGGGGIAMAMATPKATYKCDGGGPEAGTTWFGGQSGAQGHGLPTLATLSALWTCLVLGIGCVYKWQARKQRRRQRERKEALAAEQTTRQAILLSFCAQIDQYHINVVPAKSFLRGTSDKGPGGERLVSPSEVRDFFDANGDKVFPTRALLSRIEASAAAEASADFPDQAHTRLLLDARIYLSVLARLEREREREGEEGDSVEAAVATAAASSDDNAREPKHPLLCGELLQLFLGRPMPHPLWAYMVAAIAMEAKAAPPARDHSQASEYATAAIDVATAALLSITEYLLKRYWAGDSIVVGTGVSMVFDQVRVMLRTRDKARRAKRGKETVST